VEEELVGNAPQHGRLASSLRELLRAFGFILMVLAEDGKVLGK